MKRFLSVLVISFLTLMIFCGINISAAENKGVTFSYCRNDKWSNFSGKVMFPDYIDCLKIQTSKEKDYYLSYKTWNEGNSGYYSEVKSNINSSEEYAGASGKRIRSLSISVYGKDGNKINTGIVVMYRAYVGGVWLPWVSNADSDWMSYVQRKYKLDGVIDTNAGNSGINTDYIKGLEIRIFEEDIIDDLSRTDNKSAVIDAPLISQLKDYPTGCESVSTVMALNHRGFDITVDNFIDSYLETGNSDSFDPNLCFGGNPRSSNGIGCYAPAIETAVNKYLASTDKTVKPIKNYSLLELCEEYIDNGVPVILWATTDMQKASTGRKIEYEDRIIQWISPEHCLLLVGYDKNNYIFNDPQKPDTVTYYSKTDTENAYCALGCQAIAIVNKPLPDKCFSLSNTEYTYNGQVKTPTVTVKDTNDCVLTKDKDYTVSYDTGRKNTGTYKVTVKMKGNYSGTKTLTFKINPISISTCSIKLSTSSYTYNGGVKTPNVTVKNAYGTVLTKNTHYTVTYASGRKNAGTYKVTVKMKGNYSGTKTLTFKINPISISTCSIKLSTTSYTYNGGVKTPNVTVKNAYGTVLTKNTHYTVTYASGRKNAGTYKVTVKMKGNYSGTKTLTFKINPISISKCSIKLSTTSYTYNGGVKTPNVTVKNAYGTVLTKNTHYTITYASGRKNVGTYKVTIKMKGNYSGTKVLSYKILPAKTTVKKIVAGKKSLKVYINTKSVQVTGYQIQYSTSKTFKNSKTKTLTNYKTASTALNGLTSKKTYYVRIHTYKTVNGVKFYSLWSAYKYGKTK